MNLLSLYSPSMVGLDIQPHEVRLVQLKKNKHGFLVERIAKNPLPPAVFAEGKISHWDDLGHVLTELVTTLGIKGLVAAINLPANLVRMQRLQLPSGLSPLAIQDEIHVRLQGELPGMMEVLSVDYVECPSDNAAYSDVFFAAARQEYVAQLISCVNAAGLRVKVVDVDIYSLKRMVSYALAFPVVKSKVNAIAHVSNHVASLIISNASEIVFYQQWDVASTDDFLSELKNKMQVCVAAIENIDIQKLIICGSDNYLQLIANDTSSPWVIPIYYPDLFSRMTFVYQSDHARATANAADFLVSCGAAMREVPRW